MRIFLHKNFEKKYARLRASEKKKFKERRNIFLMDPYNPILNNHALRGKFKGYRSINIAGDLRAVYGVVDKGTVLFVTIDKHSNLYK